MSDDSTPAVLAARKSTLGDRIRTIASQLRQEDAVQIKATSRILGAAAKLAENHDRLIDEVVEMVEDDLDQASQLSAVPEYTVAQLKQQFKTLSDAKLHFGIKAGSWAALVDKLNQQSTPSAATSSQPGSRSHPNANQQALTQRLDQLEQTVQHLRGDINQMMQLLERVLEKLE